VTRLAVSNDPLALRQRLIEGDGVAVGDVLTMTDPDHRARGELRVSAMDDQRCRFEVVRLFADAETFVAASPGALVFHADRHYSSVVRPEQQQSARRS